MTQILPIALRYTEGSETFAVHLDGAISRPAIGMAPNGQWRLTGAGNARGSLLYDFPELFRRVVEKEGLPHELHLFDLDHGTHRMHGHAARQIWAEPGVDAETVRAARLIQLERQASERQRAEQAAKEARQRLSRRPVHWSAPAFGITLYALPRGKFALIDGEAVREDLDHTAAASALGAAIIWHASEEEDSE